MSLCFYFLYTLIENMENTKILYTNGYVGFNLNLLESKNIHVY